MVMSQCFKEFLNSFGQAIYPCRIGRPSQAFPLLRTVRASFPAHSSGSLSVISAAAYTTRVRKDLFPLANNWLLSLSSYRPIAGVLHATPPSPSPISPPPTIA